MRNVASWELWLADAIDLVGAVAAVAIVAGVLWWVMGQ